ncbi:MAG: protein kinase [Dermatophilaceae bacterium]
MSATVEQPGRADASRLGPYRIVSEVGRGGMGVVYLALDPQGRAVALKVLHHHVASDPAARQRLAREVSHLSRVAHPGVARIVDADVEGPRPYVVTRYVPGQTLDRYVADRGPLRGDALLALARDLSEALSAIHVAGVVHRDLKPGNVLMDEDRAIIIDFGIAFGEADARLTVTGLVMGTPGFLAPEILDGGPVTAATDWWAWAATLAFAACGRVPFGESPLPAVLARIRAGECDLSGVDARLAPLLAAALAPDPMRRPGRPVILAALERYASGDDVTAALPAAPHTAVLPRVSSAPPGPGQFGPWTAPPAPPAPLPTNAPEPAPYAHFHEPPPPSVDVQSQGDSRGARGEPGRQPSRPDAFPTARAWAPPPSAWPAGHPGHVAAPAAELPAQAGPAPRRTGTVLALGVLLAAVAAVAPPLFIGAGLVWSWLARTVDRTARGLWIRRGERGVRRGDWLSAVMRSPAHAVGAAVAAVLYGLLPVFVTVAVLGGVAGAATLGMGPPRGASAASSLFVAAFLGSFVAWWGPRGGPLRRGTRLVVRAVAPGRVGTLAAVAVLLVAATTLGLVSQSSGFHPQWWPLTSNPFGWSASPW